MKLTLPIFSKKKIQKPTYGTYAEALALCNQTGYEDKELCNLVALKTKNYKNHLQTQPYTVNAVHCYLTLTIQYVLLHENIPQVIVADFGGGCGAHYFETRRFIDDSKLQWTVIETPAMVKSAIEHELIQHGLSFTDSPQTASGHLLYLSSSIQYVPDPYSMLDVLIERNFSYILFNRMMLNTISDTDIITIQQSRLLDNGPGAPPAGFSDKIITYPHTTMSLSIFLNKMQQHYNLMFKFDEPTGNIDPNNKAITGGGFLFKRK